MKRKWKRQLRKKRYCRRFIIVNPYTLHNLHNDSYLVGHSLLILSNYKLLFFFVYDGRSERRRNHPKGQPRVVVARLHHSQLWRTMFKGQSVLYLCSWRSVFSLLKQKAWILKASTEFLATKSMWNSSPQSSKKVTLYRTHHTIRIFKYCTVIA